MSVDTYGKIKSFVRHEEILNFIKQKWDKDARDNVKKRITCPISECDWKYKTNEHSEDNENWYSVYGIIYFKYNDEARMLFYHYSNLNSYENLEYYSKHNLREMVETETTCLSLGCWGSSVEIIKEIVAHLACGLMCVEQRSKYGRPLLFGRKAGGGFTLSNPLLFFKRRI